MALVVIENVVSITAVPVGSVDGASGYFYMNLIITDRAGKELEITLSSKNKALLHNLADGVL